MKQYIKPKSYKLGFNIIINNNDINYYYNLNNKRHGFYFSLFLFNNTLYPCKGYYNNNTLYSHWEEYYPILIYRYFL